MSSTSDNDNLGSGGGNDRLEGGSGDDVLHGDSAGNGTLTAPMSVNEEAIGTSRSFFAGGTQVNYTVATDNGFIETRDTPNGPIDTTKQSVGNNGTPQTSTYDFYQAASKLKINMNAMSHNEEIGAFCSNTR